MPTGKKPVMDVSKPGETPADATTRPLITGHAIMQDPMVTATALGEETTSDPLSAGDHAPTEIVAPSAAHKVISPITSDVSEAEKPKEPAQEEKTEEKKPEISEEGAVVDAVLDQVTDKKKEEIIDEEELKRHKLVDKLVEEKKYFLPINQVSARRNSKILLITLGALLPLIIGLLLAIDAGAIKTNITLPFDLIK